MIAWPTGASRLQACVDCGLQVTHNETRYASRTLAQWVAEAHDAPGGEQCRPINPRVAAAAGRR